LVQSLSSPKIVAESSLPLLEVRSTSPNFSIILEYSGPRLATSASACLVSGRRRPIILSKFLSYSHSGETPIIPFVWCAAGAHETPRPPKDIILRWSGRSLLLSADQGAGKRRGLTLTLAHQHRQPRQPRGENGYKVRSAVSGDEAGVR
jgi:hypothetical protein